MSAVAPGVGMQSGKREATESGSNSRGSATKQHVQILNVFYSHLGHAAK